MTIVSNRLQSLFEQVFLLHFQFNPTKNWTVTKISTVPNLFRIKSDFSLYLHTPVAQVRHSDDSVRTILIMNLHTIVLK